ncbi:hypothetical protein [Hyphomicrobium sulfonivorans]|uniref:hypothetical protein n=1 Tax=Hyphomicrobium sulfonivorans TaxID=121290 RepID=UPI00156DDBAE|nr:hypothetical protein [Hyphomicrobium sulfonivorans]MBI1650129.1 hypothetical protein [Hyphomicrobium sulfonivorans]NSL73044.1 hypothetical protein [Hyphomicrobium sulfonivorans]
MQSTELRRFNQARSAYVDRVWAGDEKRAAVASDLVDNAIVALIERPVTTWNDVLDLAEMVVAERWTTDENGLPDEVFCDGHLLDVERALLRAMLQFGGRCNG